MFSRGSCPIRRSLPPPLSLSLSPSLRPLSLSRLLQARRERVVNAASRLERASSGPGRSRAPRTLSGPPPGLPAIENEVSRRSHAWAHAWRWRRTARHGPGRSGCASGSPCSAQTLPRVAPCTARPCSFYWAQTISNAQPTQADREQNEKLLVCLREHNFFESEEEGVRRYGPCQARVCVLGPSQRHR